MEATCKTCGRMIQERTLWAHADDTLYVQGQPEVSVLPDGSQTSVGRTVWVHSLNHHEPEPKPVVAQPTLEELQLQLTAMRELIARQRPELLSEVK